MKKQTTYYIIGAVLVGAGIYLYASKNNNKNVEVNLNPPMEVKEEDGVVTTTTNENIILTGLDKLKALIEAIKSKNVSTPPIQA
jgi:hypothetical protein